ncbi:MurR/RpiR family transcriptional regulator [Mesoplasma chauliocola]|uniref:MurR/RpiR family transcriptional regulator n=1 Tax=Mesoplasma chauliocola TaxID=216427 RepID=A0A249SP21_9MOLU|nr:MurR/RpiR family transcriptional regulator [Mesoplasma chauliocola]ASZ09415.1 MurR/RpiR family transcriptional regulator [Mesoplasma chauliocola]
MIIEKVYKASNEQEKSQRRIAETIISEITKNNKFTLGITQLAEKSQASQPTTTRFINEIYPEGNYKLFKEKLNEEIKTYFKSNYEKNNLFDNKKRMLLDITNTLEKIDDSQIIKASDLLVKANKINVASLGGNYSIKYLFEHKLTKIGKYAMLSLDWHQQLINLNFMTKTDVLIVISYSSDKNEISKIIEKALIKGIKIILLTGEFKSKWENEVDICIKIPSTDAKFRSFSFTSKTCMNLVIELIFREMLKNILPEIDVVEEWKWQNK